LSSAHVPPAGAELRANRSDRHLAVALRCLPWAVHRLPSFALPHKRFVRQVVCAKSKQLLEPGCSYRDTVRHAGQCLVYDDRQPEPLAERGAALAHTTVWRWLSWLGDSLTQTLRSARKLFRDGAPSHTLHRQTWAVSPYKHRSDARGQTLRQALELIVVASLFPRLFGKEIFPDFATGHGWQ
jgi:hypothetical protein